MLLLKGDYDDMLPQLSPAPRVGLSPPPSSCTVLEHGINFMEIISTLHVLYSCMEAQCMHISGIQEHLHRQTALLYFRLLSVTLSARV